MDLQPRRRD